MSTMKEQARALKNTVEDERDARRVAQMQADLAVEALEGVYHLVADELGDECSRDPAAPDIHCWAHGVRVGPCPMATARVALSVLKRGTR